MAQQEAVASFDAGQMYREEQTMAQMVWRAYRRHKPAMVGTIIVLILALAAVFAPLLTPYDPEKTDLDHMLQPPSASHPMGTDELGRDLLTRILYGGRVSLSIGVMAMALAVLVGATIGGLSGFYGGWIDNILMRFTDMMLSFPQLFILIILAIALRDIPIEALRGTAFASVFSIVLVIAVLAWMQVARLVRASFLSLKEKEFTEASRCIGASNSRIMLRHLLPNAMSPIIVAATFRVATSIITESGLSYLGFGVQPPTPTWGNMLKNAQELMTRAPWTAIFPGLMIFVTVIAINFIGDGLRDALDPYKAE
ncbi:MAG TPA: oligopeptide ABC transporter permease [Anaerolineae bacterium]|nr:oligopeptide ABC transporter permease [Anaerolineae bacterium]